MASQKIMKKPRLLDLFCGDGGAGMRYHKAGFDVVGIDIKPHKRYPFEFHQADAFSYPLDGFDIVHASPPCQRFTAGTRVQRRRGKIYPDCLTPIRERLKEWNGPYIIENVVGATMQPYTIVLCGLMFGLKVFRHRIFECSDLVTAPDHPTHKGKRIGEGYWTVFGHGGGRVRSWGKTKKATRGNAADWSAAMEIDWMSREGLTQAIPPAYTEWIGKQIMRLNGYGKKCL